MRNTRWLPLFLLALMTPGLLAVTDCGGQYHTLVVSKGGTTFEFEVPYAFRDIRQTLREDSGEPIDGIVLERVESGVTPDARTNRVLPTRLVISWYRFPDLEAGVERIDAELLAEAFLDAWAILPGNHEFTLMEHRTVLVAGKIGESIAYSAKFMRAGDVLDERPTYVREAFFDDSDRIWQIQLTSLPEFASQTEDVFYKLVASFKMID